MIIIIDFEGVKYMKYSKQREALLTLLRSTRSHPSADWLYENLRKEFPNISLGTVYRNLNLLTDIGEALKITTPDGADRFDGCVKPHNHFFCTECRRVLDLDLDMKEIEQINKAAATNFDGIIESSNTIFYGRCGDCIK